MLDTETNTSVRSNFLLCTYDAISTSYTRKNKLSSFFKLGGLMVALF